MIDLWFSWFLHTHQVPLGTPWVSYPLKRGEKCYSDPHFSVYVYNSISYVEAIWREAPSPY